MESKSDSIEIRLLKAEETEKARELVSLFEDVFEMEVEQIHDEALTRILEDEDFIAILAEDKGELIGGMTVYLLRQIYRVKPWAYLMDLAIHQDYQRKGIGQRMITFAKEQAKRAGSEELYVQAEKEDDHAVRFYRKTSPSGEMDVHHFFYKLA